MLYLGQPKVNEVKIFLPFQKFMKHPQTKFRAHIFSHSIVRSKKSQNLSLRQKFLLVFFSRYRYFIKVTTTDFDLFLQV